MDTGTSLAKSLERNLDRLDELLMDGHQVVLHVELAKLIHASWIRLKNWESDIKNEEKHTLEILPILSAQTAEILRARFDALETAVEHAEAADRALQISPDKNRTEILYVTSLSLILSPLANS
jgi:hypothetical protein